MVNTPERINELVESYIPHIPLLALRIINGTRFYGLDYDEIISAGHEGLLESSIRHSETGGMSFQSFAYGRVNQRMRAKLYAMQDKQRVWQLTSISDESKSDYEPEDTRYSTSQKSNNLSRMLEESLSVLDFRERKIIEGIYFDNLKFRELRRFFINSQTGRFISSTRIGQLKKRALEKLRSYFTKNFCFQEGELSFLNGYD